MTEIRVRNTSRLKCMWLGKPRPVSGKPQSPKRKKKRRESHPRWPDGDYPHALTLATLLPSPSLYFPISTPWFFFLISKCLLGKTRFSMRPDFAAEHGLSPSLIFFDDTRKNWRLPTQGPSLALPEPGQPHSWKGVNLLVAAGGGRAGHRRPARLVQFPCKGPSTALPRPQAQW